MLLTQVGVVPAGRPGDHSAPASSNLELEDNRPPMAPLPVLYVNHVSFISGAERSLLALIGHLDREKVTPYLACPQGELATRARELEVEVISLPITGFKRTHNPATLGSYMLTWVAGRNQFRKIADDIQPKIIHANSATAHLYTGATAKRLNVPCLWHSRDLRELPFPVNSICRSADAIVAVSQCVADSLGAAGFSRLKISRIHNGIDAEAWRASVTGRDVRAELGLEANARILLMAAQFVPWKRHEDAIRAMPHILAREPAARLVLAGSDLSDSHPELAPNLGQLAAELGVEEQVLFAGQRDDVADLIHAAEMVLIPSDAEPFGRVALEAMALEKPVVGTRAGGLPEVVTDGETGLLVVPRFPESLADACLRLLDNTALARHLGETGRKRVESVFNCKRIAADTVALYQRLRVPSLKWIPA